MNSRSPGRVSRRELMPLAALGAALGSDAASAGQSPLDPAIERGRASLEPYFFPQERFQDVSRGRPVPHSLSEDRRREVGLTRETWKLEIITDPGNPTSMGRQFTRKEGTAIDFQGLLKLAETHAVRFPKVMTCLNIGCPLGMGIWEGVPLRELLWLTQPKENLRRVMYHGYHNDDPPQLFRSSLPAGRVLEDPVGVPPVIVCYKLNGQWLDPKRGGPVRMVVPEAYGFKSIKWLTHIVLTNLASANDTYISGNNDVDSPLKTFAATLDAPRQVRAGTPTPVFGYAQVGVSGLTRVQIWVQPASQPWPEDDPHFARAPWSDARILPPPADWGGGLPEGRIPQDTFGFDATGRPKTWPMQLAKAHWAAMLPRLTPGEYVLRCRTIDAAGHAQPMPRPFKKSGHSAIETVTFRVS